MLTCFQERIHAIRLLSFARRRGYLHALVRHVVFSCKDLRCSGFSWAGRKGSGECVTIVNITSHFQHQNNI